MKVSGKTDEARVKFRCQQIELMEAEEMKLEWLQNELDMEAILKL